MSDEVKPITVTILDKDYLVGCKEDEREALFASVQFLNKKMIEQRDSGKVIGSERIAVMVALNIAHEYLEYRRNNESLTTDLGAGIARIRSKIADALTRGAADPAQSLRALSRRGRPAADPDDACSVPAPPRAQLISIRILKSAESGTITPVVFSAVCDH